jgi:hypothetical protein
MLIVLVGPNRSICSNSKGLLVEMWFLLLKDIFTCLLIWQASHNPYFFKSNMRKTFKKFIFDKFRKDIHTYIT